MKLRLKLVFAAMPLALALAVLGSVSSATVDALGTVSGRILHDNYRSVIAAQRMKESIDRLDEAALLALVDRDDTLVHHATALRQGFADELARQQENITEPGEDELTAELAAAWHDYAVQFDAFARAPSKAMYFEQLQPRFAAVESTADRILTLNQDAMVRRSDHARSTAERAELVVTWSSVAALSLGLLASLWIASRVLRPLDNLGLVARRLGSGDLSVRASVLGDDELAAVAREFNDMAARLERFRKSSLGELLQAQLASQAAIDSIPDPVLVFGVDGNVLSANRSAEDELELALGDAADRDVLARVAAPLRGALQLARDHVLAGKGPHTPRGFDEAVAVRRADRERWYLPRASPVYDEHGAIMGVTVIAQDVTRLRRFDELRNDMIATVAHEFRTPLTSLRMAIHLCVEGAAGELGDKQADLLGAAREDCERLQAIVDDLLDLARLQSDALELARVATPVETLVDAAVEAHREDAARANLQLRVRVTPSLPAVDVDRSRIALVFDNLLANAIRHSPGGGTITVLAEPGDDGVRIEVADHGAGIEPEHVPRVFDRFFRAPGQPPGGAGLGLSIAREVVEAHGGRIGVVSEPGHGARFWFTLPRAGAGP
ncbi:MAG: HAMP domain-containing protein [Nannocystaceae bacterium]|nr:HAMP domain-containing protein [Nannocystaceae bacterium]